MDEMHGTNIGRRMANGQDGSRRVIAMKLTKTKLKQIIKEELKKVLMREASARSYDKPGTTGTGKYAGRTKSGTRDIGGWFTDEELQHLQVTRQREEERGHPGASFSKDPLCGEDGNCQKVCGIYEACEKSKGQQLGGCTMHANLKQLMKRGKPATATMNLESWRQDCKIRKERATPGVGGLGG